MAEPPTEAVDNILWKGVTKDQLAQYLTKANNKNPEGGVAFSKSASKSELIKLARQIGANSAQEIHADLGDSVATTAKVVMEKSSSKDNWDNVSSPDMRVISKQDSMRSVGSPAATARVMHETMKKTIELGTKRYPSSVPDDVSLIIDCLYDKEVCRPRVGVCKCH